MSWVRHLRAFLVGACLIGCGSPEPEREPQAPFQLAGPLVFRRFGGFFGFDDRVEVLPSGAVLAGEDDIGVAHQLALDELKILADTLARTEAGRSTPALGSDPILYSTSYDGRTIQWAEGVIPPELEPALAILQELLP